MKTRVLLFIFLLAALQAAFSSETRAQDSRILWVDSYHHGFEWSDGIERGIRLGLHDTAAELHIFHMDTKRKSREQDKLKAGIRAEAEVRRINPDLVIASDDNAQQYLVIPYLKETGLPVVFCGVNWDATMYGYPTDTITGMLEIDLALEAVSLMRPHARGDRVGYISANMATDQKNFNYHNSFFFNDQLKGYLVSNFEEFKEAFVRTQEEVDMLIVGNYAGITNWNPDEAERFIRHNIRIPSTCFDRYMARFTVFTLGKLSEEQGQWAAETGLRILAGVSPRDIPISHNTKTELIVNRTLADTLELMIPVSVLKTAEILKADPSVED